MRYGIEDMDVHVLDARFTLKVESRDTHATRDGEWVVIHTQKDWWLLDNDTPVAFMRTLFHTGDDSQHGGCPLVLCDIEVRDGHRGNGHTHRIVEAVENIEGHQIWTSGGFTPLGAQALGWLPVYPWETPGIKYDDMTFVRDWDNYLPN